MSAPVISPQKPLELTKNLEHNKLTIIQPTVPAAKPQKRHWGLALSLVLFVFIPIGIVAIYLYDRAIDQYASTVGFSVQKEEFGSPVEFLGGIADISGSSSSDTDILNEFIQSQELVELLDDRLDLRTIYRGSSRDPFFAFPEDGSVEDLVKYWHRMASLSYDSGTGLIELRVLAFSPEDALKIATAAFEESSKKINSMSEVARNDATQYARQDLAEAAERLTDAREALTTYRLRVQIVDPAADISTQMGLIGSLQNQLAETLIARDLLHKTTGSADIRIQRFDSKIEIIRDHIEKERSKFGITNDDAVGEDFVKKLAEFERLKVERDFAEQAYATSLATYYSTKAEARRKSRYLAAYLQPTLAQTPEYPKRIQLLAISAIIAMVSWSIAALIYYSVRDRQ